MTETEATEAALEKFLNEAIGENSEAMGVPGWLDSGIPELNKAVSNNHHLGFPMGRMIEIFGPASCGKTFLATMLMIAAQKAGGIAGFSDHERSFEPVMAEMLGLNLAPARYKYVQPETFEESIEIATHFCRTLREAEIIPVKAPLIWVFDSVAAMIPHEKLYDKKGERRKIGTYNMRDKLALATATSQSYPALSQFAADYNMMVLLLNQTRVKPNVMFGDPTTTPGGQAAEFYCSVRLNIGRKDLTNGESGKKKKILGFQISSKTVKNKVARFGETADWEVRFNKGLGVTIDQITTNVNYLVDAGYIPKSGAWLQWDGKKIYKKDLIQHLKEDPKGNDKLMALLEEE